MSNHQLEGPSVTAAGNGPEPHRTLDALDLRLLFPLCITGFIGVLTTITIQPFLPSVAADLSTTTALVGQVVTATFFASALAGLFIGPLADQFGHRRTLLIGLVVTTVSALSTALAPSYGILLFSRLLGGVGNTMIGGVGLAIASERFQGATRQRALSIIAAGMALAPILGLPALTVIASYFGWRGAFAAFGLLAFTTILPVILGVPVDKRTRESNLSITGVVSAYRPVLLQKAVLTLYITAILFSICWVGARTYLGSFFIEVHGFSLNEVGVIYMVSGSGIFLGSLAAGGRVGDIDLRVIYAVTTAAMGLGWSLVLASPVVAVVAIGLVGATTFIGSIGRVSFTTLLASETPAGPATTMVLQSAMHGIGAAMGSAVGGMLIAFGGYRMLGIGLSLFAFAGALTMWHPRLLPRHAQSEV